MNAALQALDLRVDLGGQEVLHGVNLTLPAGRWTSIVGPNGAGKSTLLKALSGLLPAQGQVHWFGQPMAGIARRERGQQLSWLGQGEGASDDLRVSDVVMLGRLPFQDWLSAPSALDQQMVESALKATQAWDWRERTLGQLSGGERQRVLLARALAVNAPIMLMDEPLANLDPPHQVDWLEQVHCLLAQGTTVVSVLHEIGMALHADDVVVMQAGRVVHHGACADEATQRAIEAVFDQRIRIVSVDGQSVALPRV
ncbi:ABC transporter ATP-binding protein [Limnohabitans sp. Hippo3]|uniref:ABC transporter ATP-binding protein n=1 Tax=Limnohabitans sp. Hippo3 TaxID=1597956 RepID=UPI000D39E907|nr:ABC transporter ATP-binding protein [Limnohabitans sp. Hippo3]PUE43497.1 ABC transporter [Limnohabitans sp. Hippo3]